MPLNLYGQLMRTIARAERAILALDERHPLKRWFQIELTQFAPGPRETTSMEEVSARMRAVRQLEFMVAALLDDAEPEETNLQESLLSLMARVPSNVLGSVQQTNFSIEPRLLLTPASPVELFDLVSPTAKIVNYFRMQSGLQGFADRLSCAQAARTLLRELGIEEAQVLTRLALLFGSRYHTMNAAVARTAAPQILEIAAGISPRGLHWSREHPGTVYIESDLPALMREKSKVVRDSILADDVPRRGVLHCCGLDALDLPGLRRTLEYTDPESPLVLVTEGLLLYFDRAELLQFLSHMRTVLAERPRAVWVVDFVSRQNLDELCACDPAVARAIRGVFANTQRAVIADNPFRTDECIERTLRDSGLRVQHKALLAECTVVRNSLPGCTLADQSRICGRRHIWTIAAV